MLSIRIQLAGVFASGALVGRDSYNYKSMEIDNVSSTNGINSRVEKWKSLCEDKYHIPLPIVAIAFALLPQAVEAIAIGVGHVSELHQVMEWLQPFLAVDGTTSVTAVENISTIVPLQLWEDAKAAGLLADYVVIPN
jgi:hypothetical protein